MDGTAAATLEGFEVMCITRRGACILPRSGLKGEIHLVNQMFGFAA
jgi:hypothetical protein